MTYFQIRPDPEVLDEHEPGSRVLMANWLVIIQPQNPSLVPGMIQVNANYCRLDPQEATSETNKSMQVV